MTPQPEEDSLLAAISGTAADLDRLALIRRNRDLGVPWAAIGRAQGGKLSKVAKRDAKRLKKQTRRAWYLQQNQETGL